jgi:hypothetical protein
LSKYAYKIGFGSQNGAYFSTYDKVHSKLDTNELESISYKKRDLQIKRRNCATRSGGGWWFKNMHTCLPVNLNGLYVTGASAPATQGIKWQAVKSHDRNYALKMSKMKMKPKYSI